MWSVCYRSHINTYQLRNLNKTDKCEFIHVDMYSSRLQQYPSQLFVFLTLQKTYMNYQHFYTWMMIN
jgi:hypothetical protein